MTEKEKKDWDEELAKNVERVKEREPSPLDDGPFPDEDELDDPTKYHLKTVHIIDECCGKVDPTAYLEEGEVLINSQEDLDRILKVYTDDEIEEIRRTWGFYKLFGPKNPVRLCFVLRWKDGHIFIEKRPATTSTVIFADRNELTTFLALSSPKKDMFLYALSERKDIGKYQLRIFDNLPYRNGFEYLLDRYVFSRPWFNRFLRKWEKFKIRNIKLKEPDKDIADPSKSLKLDTISLSG
jgi:hypothetical protein